MGTFIRRPRYPSEESFFRLQLHAMWLLSLSISAARGLAQMVHVSIADASRARLCIELRFGSPEALAFVCVLFICIFVSCFWACNAASGCLYALVVRFATAFFFL